MYCRVLIVGTIPYNTKSTSRAFEAYFHYWDREALAQFFSDPKTPVQGHCSTLYQVTDYRLLQRWRGKRIDTGKVFSYNDLPSCNEAPEIEDESRMAPKAYQLGGKHTPLTHLLRGLLWKRRFWCTEQFEKWLDCFGPDLVFLSFSDDFFIPQVALFVAQKYDIPIVSSIGDDYYFNTHFSLDPLYWIYKLSYRLLIRKVLSHKGSAIYISDKIRDKYNREFGLNGETVYLSSSLTRKPFLPVNTVSPVITYFGNIRMGRNHSLDEIGKALGRIDKSFVLEVYSGEKDPHYFKLLQDNPNVKFGGLISYEEVQHKMLESDITIIVEGFKRRDIDQSRYSLSTKAADALASGSTIFTYGSEECGIVEYMKSTCASFVCTDNLSLEQTIRTLFYSPSLQKQYYDRQIIVTEDHHNLMKSCAMFEKVVLRALNQQ